jgi:hypothetical protein
LDGERAAVAVGEHAEQRRIGEHDRGLHDAAVVGRDVGERHREAGAVRAADAAPGTAGDDLRLGGVAGRGGVQHDRVVAGRHAVEVERERDPARRCGHHRDADRPVRRVHHLDRDGPAARRLADPGVRERGAGERNGEERGPGDRLGVHVCS